MVATADRIRALIPEIKRWIPADVDIHIMSDRTTTIRASLADMQRTLLFSVLLVMGVVLVYSTMMVVFNLAVDVLYRFVDPRIA